MFDYDSFVFCFLSFDIAGCSRSAVVRHSYLLRAFHPITNCVSPVVSEVAIRPAYQQFTVPIPLWSGMIKFRLNARPMVSAS